MIPVHFTEAIGNSITGMKLGLLEANEVKVQKQIEEFEEHFQQLKKYLLERFSTRSLSSDEIVGHVRRMYRRIGWEPTRYRPASEALARRILKGQNWYRINNLVDLSNIVSARYHLPMGLYDSERIAGDIYVDVGRAEESYEGISKEIIHAEGKLILRDTEGIFGNPTADSKRTAVSSQTRKVLAVFFVPPEVENSYIGKALQMLSDYFAPYAEEINKDIIIQKRHRAAS